MLSEMIALRRNGSHSLQSIARRDRCRTLKYHALRPFPGSRLRVPPRLRLREHRARRV